MSDNCVDVLGQRLLWGDAPVSEAGFVLPTGTVTLLLADVEGSSRHWEMDPELTATEIRWLNEVVDDQVGRHDGVRPVEQGEGDSFVAAFARARDAVACATAIQLALAGRPLRIRIGMHTGDVQRRDEGNYVGQTINRAARVRNLAHGGQTVLSQAARDLVVDFLPAGVTLKDLGVHRLRDLSRPERVFQLCHPDLEAEFPRLRSLDSVPNNLPGQRTSFVGRQEALEAVRSELADASLVTLTGSGGCGKTRLALQVAADTLDSYPDGGWLVDLASVVDAASVAVRAASTFAVKEGPGMSAADALAAYLADLEALIVLDNCEHVLDAAAALVDVVLRRAPKVKVLTTSRQPLGLEGEVIWRVPSLSLPAADGPAGIGAVSASEAARLFVDRARRARSGFRLDDDNAAAIADICRHLDGIPLAIELAAARVRVFAAAQIAEGLSERFRLLTGGVRTAMPRQQTLQASIDWSYDLLTGAEQSVLRRLSVFVGDFSFEAAEAVCASDDVAAHQVLDLLTLLVEKSLVQVEHEADSARYRLLETVRLYAAGRLGVVAEEDATRDRHLAFHRAWLASHGSPEGGVIPETLAAIARDYTNLRAAMAWAQQRDDMVGAAEMALGLQWFWQLRGPVEEANHWLDVALADASLPAALRAELMFARVYAAFAVFDVAEVARWATEGLAIARGISDDRLTARFLIALGLNSVFFGDPKPLLDEGVALARACGDAFALAEGLQGYGFVCQSAKPAEARSWFEESIVMAEPAANRYTADTCVTNLAIIAMLEGDLAEARQLCETVLDRSGVWGYGLAETSALAVLAVLAVLLGNHDEAVETAQRLQDACRTTGVTIMVATGPIAVAMAALGSGRADALDMCRAAAAQPIVLPQLRAMALQALIAAELAAGDPNQAQTYASELVDLGRAAYPYGEAAGLILMGQCARRTGEPAEAERLIHEGLTLAYHAGAKTLIVDALEALAEVESDYQRDETAARLLGAADGIREATGYALRLSPSNQNASADGRDDYAEARIGAAQLTIDDAVAYARRGRGQRKRTATGWAAVTPTEQQVIDLVGEGLSNAEIGKRLFVSPRTVQTHLSHVFAKLDVATRAELAAAASRRNPEPRSGQHDRPVTTS